MNDLGLKEIYKQDIRTHAINDDIKEAGALLVKSYERPLFVIVSLEEYQRLITTKDEKNSS